MALIFFACQLRVRQHRCLLLVQPIGKELDVRIFLNQLFHAFGRNIGRIKGAGFWV